MVNRPIEYTGAHPRVEPRVRYKGASYVSRHLQNLYSACLRLAADPNSELFHRHSTTGKLYRRTGASHRSAFWAGYDEAMTGFVNKLRRGQAGSDCWACYRAGVDFGEADKKAMALPVIDAPAKARAMWN